MSAPSIVAARYVCADCGWRTDSQDAYWSHRRIHSIAAGSRRVVVTQVCGHSYGVLVAADRPSFYRPGDEYWCFECRGSQAVRRVSG